MTSKSRTIRALFKITSQNNPSNLVLLFTGSHRGHYYHFSLCKSVLNLFLGLPFDTLSNQHKLTLRLYLEEPPHPSIPLYLYSPRLTRELRYTKSPNPKYRPPGFQTFPGATTLTTSLLRPQFAGCWRKTVHLPCWLVATLH